MSRDPRLDELDLLLIDGDNLLHDVRGSREPLQFGAEIYGHAGLEADLEAIELALDGLRANGIDDLLLELGDARIVRAVLGEGQTDEAVIDALARKDQAALSELARAMPPARRDGVLALSRLYGGPEVLDAARPALAAHPAVARALEDLAWLAGHVQLAHPTVRIGFDLADISGYAYYSGVRFTLYSAAANAALARGGRYDEVGAVFGRNRPAVGFSLDVKALVQTATAPPAKAAVRAPWGEASDLRAAVRRLREQGQMVVCSLPGHEHEAQEYDCDRELVEVEGRWILRAL